MRYMKLDRDERAALLAELEAMPAYLRSVFGALDHELARRAGPGDGFCPVEQVWHLADLEVEGFGVRIDRLLAERDPELPDFDGTAVAAARRYRTLSLAEGLVRFEAARRANLAKLRAVRGGAWRNSGTLAGVGEVSLCDMPTFLQQHDAAHRAEIRAWAEHVRAS